MMVGMCCGYGVVVVDYQQDLVQQWDVFVFQIIGIIVVVEGFMVMMNDWCYFFGVFQGG